MSNRAKSEDLVYGFLSLREYHKAVALGSNNTAATKDELGYIINNAVYERCKAAGLEEAAAEKELNIALLVRGASEQFDAIAGGTYTYQHVGLVEGKSEPAAFKKACARIKVRCLKGEGIRYTGIPRYQVPRVNLPLLICLKLGNLPRLWVYKPSSWGFINPQLAVALGLCSCQLRFSANPGYLSDTAFPFTPFM